MLPYVQDGLRGCSSRVEAPQLTAETIANTPAENLSNFCCAVNGHPSGRVKRWRLKGERGMRSRVRLGNQPAAQSAPRRVT